MNKFVKRIVHGQNEMLRINTPLTLMFDIPGAVLACGGMIFDNLTVLSNGLCFIGIDFAISYVIGRKL